MKVKVKDLSPNPFRHLENYKIDGRKVEALKSSIDSTGFWDNVIARDVNGEIQIAYGHHRRAACLEINPDMVWEVPVKPLSDADMIRIMADENLNEWAATAAVIDETIDAVNTYLKQNRSELASVIQEIAEWKVGTGTDIVTKGMDYQISWFLGWRGENAHSWNPNKCKDALSRLEDFNKEEGVLNKDAAYDLPSATHTKNFQQVVKAAASKGEKLTDEEQQEIVDKINDEGLGKRKVAEVVQEKLREKRVADMPKTKVKSDPVKDRVISDYDFQIRTFFNTVNGEWSKTLKFLIETKETYKDVNTDTYLSRVALVTSLEKIAKQIEVFTNLLKEEK